MSKESGAAKKSIDIEAIKKELLEQLRSEAKEEIKAEELKKIEAQEKNVRVYKGEQEVDHDLFKLDIAITRKLVGYNKADPSAWQSFEHCHFFSSHDSDGKVLTTCGPTAGHFHEVKFNEVNGELVAECGPAMTRRRIKGRDGKVRFQNVPYENDFDSRTGELRPHKHPVKYIRSEKIKVRQVNAEAQKVIAQIAQEDRTLNSGVTHAADALR